LLQITRTVPIVFVSVPDPIGIGFVDSLARPGGNVTGFVVFEFGLAGKWLELLKQIAPSVTRAAVMRDPDLSVGVGQWSAIQSAAPPIGVEVSLVNLRDAGEIERAVTAFARSPNGGMILTSSALAYAHSSSLVSRPPRHSTSRCRHRCSLAPTRLSNKRSFLLRCMSPLLAHSGHEAMSESCPLLGVKRTWAERLAMSANDPSRAEATLVAKSCGVFHSPSSDRNRTVHNCAPG
jgi:ABC transporter substrate binding protein